MNMRTLFQENDLVCAEIHSVNNDKTINLHTRNVKYGKVNSLCIHSSSMDIWYRLTMYSLRSRSTISKDLNAGLISYLVTMDRFG